MNIYQTALTESNDCKLCVAIIAGVYAPLLLILSAAAFAF